MDSMTDQLQTIGPDFAPVLVDEFFLITPSGLQVRGEPDFNQCELFWKQLRSMEKGIQFAIGDAAKYLRKRFGDRADQIISAATGWSHETVRAYEWTAENVPEQVRHMEELTYSHHQAVGKLPPREQGKWLDKAAKGDGEKPWSVSRLKSAMKDEGAEPSYWLMVKCKNSADRDRLQKRLESEGYVTSERGA